MTLEEAKKEFLRYLVSRKNRSYNTANTYDKIINDFIGVVGNKEIKVLSIEDIDHYADDLFERGNCPKTRRNRLAAIRSMIRFLYIRDESDIKPEKIDLPIVKKQTAVWLTTAEARRLVKVITNVRDRALVLTLLSTWARINEALDLRVEDVYRGSAVIQSGKGDETRVVFLNFEAREAIRAYLTDFPHRNGYLFMNKGGTRLHERYVRRIIKFYALKAGIDKNVSCHTLRHTGATGFLEDGGRVEDAQQILGHHDISTTMIYLHFRNDRLRRTHAKHVSPRKYTTYPQKNANGRQKVLAK